VHNDAVIFIYDNMKKIIVSLLFLLGILNVYTQNLIPNPGFDSIILCPSLTLNTGGSPNINLFIPPWSAVGDSDSPDVYNECSTNSFWSVPYNRYYNWLGSISVPVFQPALSGKGYAGIGVYQFIRGNPISERREYLETPLTKPLDKNVNYFVQFYVSPVNSLNAGSNLNYIDAIGLKFTDTFLRQGKLPIITEPSVSNKKGKILKDTVNWIPITGCYKAKGGEKYATIGNFIPDNEVQFETNDPSGYATSGHFFLEDVSVIAFNPLPDTIVLCENKTVKLTTPKFKNLNHLWNTGSTDTTITVNKAGIYKVEIALDECILSDSVVVIMPKTTDKPLRDTSICKGQTIVLNPKITGQYQWSTGAKTPEIKVYTEGSYSVTVSNVCGNFTYNSTVKLGKCDCSIFVPTAFSPNNDGVNDELQAFIDCDIPIKVKRFQVFNRWGNLVFTQQNTNNIRWNGQVNGTQIDQGTFVWFMEYEIEKNGKIETKTEYGDFTIIL
jgi:gliding motility-associated-like protein